MTYEFAALSSLIQQDKSSISHYSRFSSCFKREEEMKLLSLISGKGFVMYSKVIAKEVSVNASIVFGQLCSSYESFSSKNMLTIRGGKEYFFLTSDTLEKETSLTYKLQLKATKELEEHGFIETKVMGVPSKKFFHITNQIEKTFLLEGNPRYAQKEKLDLSKNKNIPSYSPTGTPKCSHGAFLAIPKGLKY